MAVTCFTFCVGHVGHNSSVLSNENRSLEINARCIFLFM